jgi:hypothetical protein
MLIAVMCSEKNEKLDACIKSIENQNLNFKNENIEIQIFTNPTFINREEVIQSAQHDMVFFLDADCRLPHRDFLKEALSYFKNRDVNWGAVGGMYLNPLPNKNSRNNGFSFLVKYWNTYWQRSYNFICNLWVLLSEFKDSTKHEKEVQNLLGGCFFVNKSKILSLPTNPIPWGGEDTFLLRQLAHQAPIKFISSLSVIHEPDVYFLGFIKRAFLHGKNQKIFQLQTKRFQLSKSVCIFIFQNWLYWPILFFHLAVVELGKLAPVFVHANKKTKSLIEIHKF